MRKGMPMRFSFKEMLEWTLDRPLVVISIILAVTLFFALQIRHLSFKTSIYDLLIEDLPETARYEDFKNLFGSDEIIRVVVKGENVFDALAFRKIEQLTEHAAQIDGVRRVISLPGIKKAVDVTGNWSIEKFHAVVSGADLFQKNLFSTDGKTTALTLVLKNEAVPEDVIQGVRNLIAETSTDLTLYQIGMPLVSEALAKFTEKDFFAVAPNYPPAHRDYPFLPFPHAALYPDSTYLCRACVDMDFRSYGVASDPAFHVDDDCPGFFDCGRNGI